MGEIARGEVEDLLVLCVEGKDFVEDRGLATLENLLCEIVFVGFDRGALVEEESGDVPRSVDHSKGQETSRRRVDGKNRVWVDQLHLQQGNDEVLTSYKTGFLEELSSDLRARSTGSKVESTSRFGKGRKASSSRDCRLEKRGSEVDADAHEPATERKVGFQDRDPNRTEEVDVMDERVSSSIEKSLDHFEPSIPGRQTHCRCPHLADGIDGLGLLFLITKGWALSEEGPDLKGFFFVLCSDGSLWGDVVCRCTRRFLEVVVEHSCARRQLLLPSGDELLLKRRRRDQLRRGRR